MVSENSAAEEEPPHPTPTSELDVEPLGAKVASLHKVRDAAKVRTLPELLVGSFPPYISVPD